MAEAGAAVAPAKTAELTREQLGSRAKEVATRYTALSEQLPKTASVLLFGQRSDGMNNPSAVVALQLVVDNQIAPQNAERLLGGISPTDIPSINQELAALYSPVHAASNPDGTFNPLALKGSIYERYTAARNKFDTSLSPEEKRAALEKQQDAIQAMQEIQTAVAPKLGTTL